MNSLTSDQEAIALVRKAAETSFVKFIQLVHPHRVLGHVHVELADWMSRRTKKTHQLVLLPRDHGKSAMAAYYCAWRIVKDPTIRILYISATSNLATKQLKFIKDILASDVVRLYWPDLVNKDEGKREKWTETEIAVDHPLRKKESVRDPTVFTAGLTTSITGMHCDLAVLDDVVINENAYSEEGRQKVKEQYALLSSIEGAEAEELVVGTRYHPDDLYGYLISMTIDHFDESGNIIKSVPLYEVFERKVESKGDGTGEFLWPREQRYDGKWFGFNAAILAKKKAQYKGNMRQFRAQYYNDPLDLESAKFKKDYFQYYDRQNIIKRGDQIYVNNLRVSTVAAIDFAYTLGKDSDYTAIVVIGMDRDRNIYVLDIDRFKTDRLTDYYERIKFAYLNWGISRLAAEVNSAQKIIVEDLRRNYFPRNNIYLPVEEMQHSGYRTVSKEERIEVALLPLYENRQIWHYFGGNCQILEEELLTPNSSHDDVKDALAMAVKIAVPPAGRTNIDAVTGKEGVPGYAALGIQPHSRFGGIF